MNKIIQICPYCNGEGKIPIGKYYVTHDMAIDAGCPEMEGDFYDFEWDRCSECHGGGAVEEEKEVKE